MQSVHHVAPRTCSLSHGFSFQKLSYLRQSDDALELVFEMSFIRYIHYFYVPQFNLLVLPAKHKYIFSSDNISRPSIMLYLWLIWESSTWKSHIIIFIAYNSGSKISTLMIYLVLKSPTCVLQKNWSLFLFQIFAYVYLL